MLPKETVRRFIEQYQTGADENALETFMHPDVVDHSRPTGVAPGAEGVRQQFDALRAAFADFRATSLDQIAEGDMVVTRKVFTGRTAARSRASNQPGDPSRSRYSTLSGWRTEGSWNTGTVLTGSAC